jgi:hypothetical protein
MLHPSSNQQTKPDGKMPPSSFPFPVPNVEGIWKNLKMSYSMTGNSVVLKARAVRFSLLDRACGAAHSADIGFS